MPSGAKKRKAAKKKKEQQAYHHHPNGNNPQGNGDQKVEDERDSDISELNSPGSEGNPHHQDTFREGNGLPEKTGMAAENQIAENPNGEAGPSDEAGHHDDVVIKREGDEKSSDQEVKSRDVTIEHIDSGKSSDGDRSSTSSSSSSDDESSTVQDKHKEVVIQVSEAQQQPPNEVITEMESAEVVNPEVKLPTSYQSNEVLLPSDSGKNQEVFPTSDQNVEVIVTSKTVSEDKTTTSLGSATETSIHQDASTETGVDAVYAKDTKISESIEKQPLVTNNAPRLAQRTSWFSCCGLLDAVSSPDR
ncbi:unnamed protein product [Linum tenue]|uniref:Uncharacterized protein n=1 Tax=Linum tenue TaxID=586396 RepID=A0AAV0N0S1_9ROSI|nr:unnamed protein product [Linum tenue]